MRTRTNRTGAAIVSIVAVSAALIVSGCGSSGGSTGGGGGGSGDPVAQAASLSNSSGGYKMTFNMTINSSALPQALTATGSGSFNSGNRSGTVNLAMNFGSIPGISAVLGSSNLNMQEIIDGQTFYIKLPSALASKLPGGKPWISINLSQLGAAAGIPGIGSLLNNPTTTNPASMLQYLRAVSGGVTKVATANVNGYPTTEYRATIDFSKYPALVPPAQRAQAQQAIAALQKMVKLKAFPVMVWVDSHHLVRRMQFAFDETVPTSGQSVKTLMTLNMAGYGPQPSPSIPGASQVASANGLLGSVLGAGG
jgi:hypothetical protein